jgi:HSF-type DNA-binding
VPDAIADFKAYNDYADKDTNWVAQQKQSNPLLTAKKGRGGPKVSFPFRLHEMLESVESSPESAAIAGWQQHGRSFKVHDRKRFQSLVLPSFFPFQSTFASFQRQLNIYGFRRLTGQHADQGTYYHEYFLRGRQHLCELMPRNSNAQPSVVFDSSTEPDFSSLPTLPSTNAANVRTVSSHSQISYDREAQQEMVSLRARQIDREGISERASDAHRQYPNQQFAPWVPNSIPASAMQNPAIYVSADRHAFQSEHAPPNDWRNLPNTQLGAPTLGLQPHRPPVVNLMQAPPPAPVPYLTAGHIYGVPLNPRIHNMKTVSSLQNDSQNDAVALQFGTLLPNVGQWPYGTVPGASVSSPYLGPNYRSIGSYSRAPTQQQWGFAPPPTASFPSDAAPTLPQWANGEATTAAAIQSMRSNRSTYDQLTNAHHRAFRDAQQHPSALQSVGRGASLLEAHPMSTSSEPNVEQQHLLATFTNTPHEPEPSSVQPQDHSPDWLDDQSIQSHQETGSLVLSCGSTSSLRRNSSFGKEDGTNLNPTA